MILEVCVDSVESAVNAESGGADRLELCGALEIGGITPGPGILVSAVANVNIPVNVMVRPRGGDFLYSDTEFEAMRRDIDFAGEAGASGLVLGILLPDGTVDVERVGYLVEYAAPMTVTFHRAFDMTNDPMKALEALISTGVSHLLTSGQTNSAPEGSALIKSLVKTAAERIVIMPGAGLNEHNIEAVARITGAREFHLTGRKVVESGMRYRRQGIALGHPLMADDEYVQRYTDTDRIAIVRKILSSIH